MKKVITLFVVVFALYATQVLAQLPAGMVKLLPDNATVTTDMGANSYDLSSFKKHMVCATGPKVFFTAKEATDGEELWVSDGTVAGTHMVKDIYPGTTGSNPQWLCAVGGLCYFAATTPEAGTELWVSDGTADGTKMVKDIYPGGTSSSPAYVTAFGNKVLFFAMDEESEALPVMSSSTSGEQWLWISDGTDAGTIRIGDAPLVGNGDGHGGKIQVTWDGKKAFYEAFNPDPANTNNYGTLWVTDGTKTGTFAIPTTPLTDDSAIQWLTAIGNKAVFRAETPASITTAVDPANASLGVNGDIGQEIWVSDGTVAGTKWIGIDFAKGAANGTPTGTQFAYTLPLNDHLMLFRADDGVDNVQPCILDLNMPFKDGTQLATPAVPDLNPKMIFDVNPWGKPSSTAASWPQYWRGVYNGMVYFNANGTFAFNPDQYSGYSMWRCDVSSMDINTIDLCEFIMNWTNPPMVLTGTTINVADGSNGWTEANGKLWFAGATADDGSNVELWSMPDNKTNPSVYYDFPGTGNPSNLLPVQNALFFVAGDATQGDQYPSLYMVGGSLTGIQNIKAPAKLNIYPNPATDVVNISDGGTINEVTVTDIQGRKVLEQSGKSQTVNVSSLKGGLYIINVKLNDGSTLIQKLIVK